MRETEENKKWEGYEAASAAGEAWSETLDNQQQAALEGESESSARWALRGGFITRLRVISY